MSSALRLVIIIAVLAGGTYFVYDRITGAWQDRTIADLRARNVEMQQRVAERETMIRRLARTRRVAHLEVVDQTRTLDGEISETSIRFIELDDDGAELGRQNIQVPGRFIYVDAWTVKFDPGHVASGHPLYGRTLILLRRIFSERLAPEDGILLDVPGAVPPGYAVGDVGIFQKRLWADFWDLTTDPDAAEARHIRVAQGEAVYKPMTTGDRFELIVDAVGGMSLMPLRDNAPSLTHLDE